MRKQLRRWFWELIGCLLMAWLLLACATPSRTVSSTTWDGATTHSLVLVHEEGMQLLWGERQDTAATPETLAASRVSKRTMGVVGGAVAGAAIGAMAGNPAIGALTGTVAGGLGQALDNAREDRATTGTLGLWKR